jgi:hypothetical protein
VGLCRQRLSSHLQQHTPKWQRFVCFVQTKIQDIVGADEASDIAQRIIKAQQARRSVVG